MKRKSKAAGPEEIAAAAQCIRAGLLVAFPTETVYGLGANALDPDAVARIYEAKKRPAASPLIVHVASLEQARELAAEWPEAADKLAQEFWPGPLTLVLPKKAVVPDIVTAGLPTVGLRMPDHPVALALIREAGVPVAAPSANPFTKLSPTRPNHLDEELREAVAAVLEGGPARVGIESTVLSLAGPRPVLLRPGAVSRVELEKRIGPVEEAGRVSGAHPAPGMHPRHYAPRTRLVLVRDGRLPAEGRGAYLWRERPAEAACSVRMPETPEAYAASLYDTLHRLDREGWDWIAVEEPPETPEWSAVRDRLRRASGDG